MKTSISRNTVAAFAVVCLVGGYCPTAIAAPPVEITTCGQVLEQHGYLSADLDCSADLVDGPTVSIGRGGRLELRGFTLTGRPNTADAFENPTVNCRRGCKVIGPGTVVGSEETRAIVIGTESGDRTRILIDSATISGGAIGVRSSRAVLRNAVITGVRDQGTWAHNVNVADSLIIDNGTDANLGHHGVGLWSSGKTKIKGSTLTGNGRHGVFSERLRIVDSTFSGNGTNPFCVDWICRDFATGKRPRFKNSTCETSYDGSHLGAHALLSEFDPAIHTWGLCDLD